MPLLGVHSPASSQNLGPGACTALLSSIVLARDIILGVCSLARDIILAMCSLGSYPGGQLLHWGEEGDRKPRRVWTRTLEHGKLVICAHILNEGRKQLAEHIISSQTL